MTILLIDDEDYILRATSRTLRDMGYVVVTADSIDDGMWKLRDPGVNLVITDWNIGLGCGSTIVEACKRVDLPVVVHSAIRREVDVPVITKPSSREDWISVFQQLAEKHVR